MLWLDVKLLQKTVAFSVRLSVPSDRTDLPTSQRRTAAVKRHHRTGAFEVGRDVTVCDCEQRNKQINVSQSHLWLT